MPERDELPNRSLRNAFIAAAVGVAVGAGLATLAHEVATVGEPTLSQAVAPAPHHVLAMHAGGARADAIGFDTHIDYLPEHLHPAQSEDSASPSF